MGAMSQLHAELMEQADDSGYEMEVCERIGIAAHEISTSIDRFLEAAKLHPTAAFLECPDIAASINKLNEQMQLMGRGH